MEGFIKLHRKIMKWGWYSDPITKAVFLHLLLTANFRETEYKGHYIMPGQTIIGRKKLAQDLGLSEQQVRTALNHLKLTNEITIKATNKFSIVTIENWRKYNVENSESDHQNNQLYNQQLTINQPTTNQQLTINQPHLKNDKNDKKEKNDKNDKKSVYDPPTLEDVENYCAMMGYSVNPVAFVYYYENRDWMIDGQKMKDWKAVIRSWENTQDEHGKEVNE